MRQLIICLFVTSMLVNCGQKEKKAPFPAVKYFELSYYSGWAVKYNLRMDSSGLFYFSKDLNHWCRGQVPESIRDSLFNRLIRLKYDTAVRTYNTRCDDCPAANLKIVSATDTSMLFQAGELHPVFYALIDTVYEKQKHWTCVPADTLLLFETLYDLIPPPPPMIEPPRASDKK